MIQFTSHFKPNIRRSQIPLITNAVHCTQTYREPCCRNGCRSRQSDARVCDRRCHACKLPKQLPTLFRRVPHCNYAITYPKTLLKLFRPSYHEDSGRRGSAIAHLLLHCMSLHPVVCKPSPMTLLLFPGYCEVGMHRNPQCGSGYSTHWLVD